MAKLVSLTATRPPDEGEVLVINYLKEKLPDSYTLFPNVEVEEPGRPPFEYDLIVVAPHAIYVVDVKRWLGGIRGDDYTWVVAGEHKRRNPWSTTNNKSRALKNLIQRHLPALGSIWVQAVVAIADDQANLVLEGQSGDWSCCYKELPDLLGNTSALGDKVGDLGLSRAHLEQAIEKRASGRSAESRRFGSYEVVETLSRSDHVTEYLARNIHLRGHELVRLRLFSYEPNLPSDQLKYREEAIRREAEALQKIGTHVNLITSRGFMTDSNDANLFIAVTDWSEEGTLRDLMSAETPLSLDRKLELAIGIAAGLKAVHDADVIHRDVRPENILIGHDGQPRLMNFDHARLTVPGIGTIGPIRHDPDVSRAYMAPELLNPLQPPAPATDLYGLGWILFEMLTGSLLYDSPEEALKENTSFGGPAAFEVSDIPDRLNELVRLMSKPDSTQRPQSAAKVVDELRAIREKPSGTIVSETPSVLPEPSVEPEDEPNIFSRGDIIDDKYQVQEPIAAGGFSQVYRVYDQMWDDVFALKVFKNPNAAHNFLRQEVQSLKELNHPNVARIHTWGVLRQTKRLYLVSEFIEGEELTKYTSPNQRLPVREAVKAITDLLDALATIHPDVDRIAVLKTKEEMTSEEFQELQQLGSEGWLHRDIKPANLILSREGVKLVDFNIAAEASKANRTAVGTPAYMFPDVGMIPWSTDADLFATGIVLYELVTGHHPYPNRQPSVDTPATNPRQYVSELDQRFVDILLRAISCDEKTRYHSARRLRKDLEELEGIYLQASSPALPQIDLLLESSEQGKSNYNPYVTRLLTLYSQARRDNSGTRGLGDIARRTYVQTRLDTGLQPAVLDGQYRLVIITGNAGDGKTAFIQNLEQVVKEAGGHIERPTANSSVFVHHGVRFTTNYDGSQDEGAERANDQVLSEFFAAFTDKQFDQSQAIPSVHLIAINKGRLLDFFRDPAQAPHFKRLSDIITNFFDPDSGPHKLPDRLCIIDLNNRSVIARDLDSGNKSIFERQLEALLQPEFWAPCQSCALQEQCFIKFNVDTLADPASGPAVRERLRTLFEIVHLRRQLHITMRDMRSALSWLLFRDHTCDDVADLLKEQSTAEKRLSLMYNNAYAADGQPLDGRHDDRLVRLLREIDPAEAANPVVDRILHFQGLAHLHLMTFEKRSPLAKTWLHEWKVPLGWQAAQDVNQAKQHHARHAILRRIAFFERRDDNWMSMLPYQLLPLFRKVTQAVSDDSSQFKNIKEILVQGFSMAEGARDPELAHDYVSLRASKTSKVKIKSFRLFSNEDFKLRVPNILNVHYVEYTPDQIIFYHDPQDPSQKLPSARPAELVVSLDLLELLYQIGEGFMPSPDDLSGAFINLLIFKNALAHLPYRRVLLTRDDSTFYEIRLEDVATLKLQLWKG